MKIKSSISKSGKFTVVVKGDLDIYSVREFYSVLTQGISQATSVQLNLQHVGVIDFSAIQVIAKASQYCEENDIIFQIRYKIDCDGDVMSLFDLNRYRRQKDVQSNSSTTPRKLFSDGDPTSEHLYVSVQFDSRIFKYGFDPLICLQYLYDLTCLQHASVTMDNNTGFMTIEPELCYIGLSFTCTPDTMPDDVRKAFEILRDDCDIKMVPPGEKFLEIASLLRTPGERAEQVKDFVLFSDTLNETQLETVNTLSYAMRQKRDESFDSHKAESTHESHHFSPALLTSEACDQLAYALGVSDLDARRVTQRLESLDATLEVLDDQDGGRRFVINLPDNMASIDGFLVRAGEDCYIVPKEVVVACVHLDQHRDVIVKGKNRICMDDEIMPCINLDRLFSEDPSEAEPIEAVVTIHHDRKIVLLVDEIIGEVKTEIKSLDSILKNVKGISGAVVLEKKQVALILDVPGLVEQLSLSAEVDVHSTDQEQLYQTLH